MRKWVLPEHIDDILPAEAEAIESLRRRLLDHFKAHAYRLVQPPLVAPRAWRETFRKVTELSDGQLRFIGLASVAIGAIGLAMLYA